jgi:hypothetical protein
LDKSVLGLLGGASALALASGGAMAASAPTTAESGLKPAQSFAELLDPVPNAVDTLRAEEQKGQEAGREPIQLAPPPSPSSPLLVLVLAPSVPSSSPPSPILP